ncbi:hypothetical protein J2Z66_005692 [Paenibacillus eucommiae]|uniref:Uncharacterized protein n=1 Tax=Paenibacillus eucommiae TaxID=1355755 RepID=A0ABS4J4A4_9BACL|nr:hypothetical protein [Paenibacillus eucommiae]
MSGSYRGGDEIPRKRRGWDEELLFLTMFFITKSAVSSPQP